MCVCVCECVREGQREMGGNEREQEIRLILWLLPVVPNYQNLYLTFHRQPFRFHYCLLKEMSAGETDPEIVNLNGNRDHPFLRNTSRNHDFCHRRSSLLFMK